MGEKPPKKHTEHIWIYGALVADGKYKKKNIFINFFNITFLLIKEKSIFPLRNANNYKLPCRTEVQFRDCKFLQTNNDHF